MTGEALSDHARRYRLWKRRGLSNRAAYTLAGFACDTDADVRRVGLWDILTQPGVGRKTAGRIAAVIGGWDEPAEPGAPVLRLPAWSFQPDDDTPGLYLQCETVEQRERIMRLLGAPSGAEGEPEAPSPADPGCPGDIKLMDALAAKSDDLRALLKRAHDALHQIAADATASQATAHRALTEIEDALR